MIIKASRNESILLSKQSQMWVDYQQSMWTYKLVIMRAYMHMSIQAPKYTYL